MFLINGFKSVYSFKNIFNLKQQNLFKSLIYFLVISIISLLPHNLSIVREDGFKLGFISESYNDDSRLELYDSNLIKIGSAGLRVSNEVIEEYSFNMYTLVIDYNDEYIWEEGNVLVLNKFNTRYYDDTGNTMQGNYDSFSIDINKSDLMFNDNLFLTFFTNLEKTFSSHIILFSVIINTTTNICMYLLMICALAFILGFLKYRFSYFPNYKQLLNVLIYSMSLPAVVVFVLGLFGSFAFTPVIMNFATGGIALLVILKVGKNNYELKES